MRYTRCGHAEQHRQLYYGEVVEVESVGYVVELAQEVEWFAMPMSTSGKLTSSQFSRLTFDMMWL